MASWLIYSQANLVSLMTQSMNVKVVLESWLPRTTGKPEPASVAKII